MNPLEELHIFIDGISWDCKQESLFNEEFQKTNDRIREIDKQDLLRKSEIERQTFAFNKGPKDGLSFKMAGTKTLEDGTEIPFEWPDIREWTKENFDYINSRFNECKNLFDYSICPMDVIEPGLRLFFDELEKWRIDNSYSPNFICATDSLVSKMEYIIRFFCKRANISTFTDKIKNSHAVKNEKNIDELLRSLKHSEENPTGFLEEHRKFIEYVLASKMGNNLRHRVAHGLMDAQEYTVTNLILLLNIILILSTYQLKNSTDHED